MSNTFIILNAIAPIGAIDVIYYHLYKFRLFQRDASVGEEITHLVRQACFVVAAALLAAGVPSRLSDGVLLAVLAIDFVNSGIDVLLEPRSRASLGGLPRGEYFLHFLGTFGTGAAAASYLYERTSLAHVPVPAWQSAPLVLGGIVLFVIELGLFVRTRAPRGFVCCGSSHLPT